MFKGWAHLLLERGGAEGGEQRQDRGGQRGRVRGLIHMHSTPMSDRSHLHIHRHSTDRDQMVDRGGDS